MLAYLAQGCKMSGVTRVSSREMFEGGGGSIWKTHSMKCLRPVGRGGSRGFGRTPLLASKRFHMHRLTVHFKCPTV